MSVPMNLSLFPLSKSIIAEFDAAAGGEHPGFRATHARGVLLRGFFTPAPAAAQLSSAPHFVMDTVSDVVARFSSGTGIPNISDTDPNAQARGFAVRFELGPPYAPAHTDIIAHSADGFPARTGEEFLALQQALRQDPGPFLATHPAAQAFLDLPKPAPASFAQEQFFALNAFKLVAESGVARFARYTWVPTAGVQHLDDATVQTLSPNFLYDELSQRIANGTTVEFELWAQLAEDGDVTDDVTVHWPETRERVLLGTVALDRIAENNAEEQRLIIFDPIPHVQGIEPSDDPLLDLRTAAYLVSGTRRRAAEPMLNS